MKTLIEIALMMILPLVLPMVVSIVSAVFASIVHFFSRNTVLLFVFAMASAVFFYMSFKWSLCFPASMDGDWFARDIVPFLNVTFY